MSSKKEPKLTSIPTRYSSDWLERIDHRTNVARAVLARITALESDAGGPDTLSAARRSLIRHTAWLDAIIETDEMRLAAGESIDIGSHTQSLNSLLGLYRMLGLERRARPAQTLREVMEAEAQPEPSPQPDYDAEPMCEPEAQPDEAEAAP